MSYKDLIESPYQTFKIILNKYPPAHNSGILHAAILAQRSDIVFYLINEKGFGTWPYNLMTALTLPHSDQNDQMIQLLTKELDFSNNLIYQEHLFSTGTDLQIKTMIDAKALEDPTGKLSLTFVKTRPQVIRWLAQTIKVCNQESLNKLHKTFSKLKYTDTCDYLQSLIDPSHKPTPTINQLMIFLKKNHMDDQIKSLEEAIEAYSKRS